MAEQIKKLPLVKNASTFKLIIPQEVEAKIRYLCNRVHEVEWSGTLFYKVEGSLNDNSLIATCLDIFVMDIGTSVYTEYNEAPDVISYMCEHPELLEEGVFEGLIHSHNNMATFFSGTDTNTLIEEGTNANHFLSLIVNNAGSYTAGITRKIIGEIKAKARITYTKNTYYDSFGNNRIVLADNVISETDKEELKVVEHIEWFEAIIDKAEVPNNFSDIDSRLSEIKVKKSKNRPNYYDARSSTSTYHSGNLEDKVAESHSITTPAKNNIKECDKHTKKAEQLSFFEEVEDSMEEVPLCMCESFDEDILEALATQLLTGSLLINSKNVKLEEWVKSMDAVYERRFGPLGFDGKSNYTITSNLERLETWIETFVDFLVFTRDENLLRKLNGEEIQPSNNFDESDTAEVCAYGLYWKLNDLPESKVKDIIMEQLKTYLPNDIFKY